MVMMDKRQIVDGKTLQIVISRLCHQLLEDHGDFSNSIIVGLQPRGSLLSQRLVAELKQILGYSPLHGKLDVTFYRDDFRRREQPLKASSTEMDFTIEGKRIILIDDVLFTGRSVRAGLDALLDFGRPSQVQLLVLLERKFSRDLPIEPDYLGLSVHTLLQQRIKVEWTETDGADNVWLLSK